MRIATAIGLALLITSLGCTHTQSVSTGTAPFDALRRNAIDERVTVTLADRQYQDVQLVRLTSNQVAWMVDGGPIMSVPTDSVYTISLVNRSSGRWEGAGLGLLGGAAMGVLIGLSSGSDERGSNGRGGMEWDLSPRFSAGEKALGLGLSLGIVGGVAGGVIGSSIGSTEIYHIERPPSPPRRPVKRLSQIAQQECDAPAEEMRRAV